MMAVDAADHRLWPVEDLVEHVDERPAGADAGHPGLRRLEIGPGAEGVAGVCEHDHPDRLVGGSPAEIVAEAGDQLV
jgi:hypothetical protein